MGAAMLEFHNLLRHWHGKQPWNVNSLRLTDMAEETATNRFRGVHTVLPLAAVMNFIGLRQLGL